jgi:hypothetical protein
MTRADALEGSYWSVSAKSAPLDQSVAVGTPSPTSGWVTISHNDPRPLNTRPLN